MVRRLTWQVGTVAAVREETATAKTLVLDVPEWTGHLAGQHLDIRLTAPDGYSTERSYSIASATAAGRVEITVQRVEDGEVSPYLTDVLQVGDPLELRGPVGGYFVWRPADEQPVQLIAGGSGIVPLMAMARTRVQVGSAVPFRLLYSVRSPEEAIYRDELPGLGFEVTYAYTRRTPPEWPTPAGRVDAGLLAATAWSPDDKPRMYVCGPTPFVEVVANLLVNAGHDPAAIRTERFGPAGK
ncbi:ferredoxin reductase [Cryptosporangium aurantiacum]|uniref:Ferredoxin-NADP reductase n=1 Tax=Cryptosporangium aurantiacum TaxID=134849 RepID=A0A1M7RNI5_9ACTN|nr:ferredoxin reductase [Cryptosporangium aurantiacum]SHN47895.1 Ferredoxin-NADP reductase [Cryptosporangium aurantiacum]